MPSPASEAYITATLTSANQVLDLSGKQPLTLTITLTLHASAPILAYTELHDTFFLPRNALTDQGIIFRDHHTKEEIRTCHIDSCRTPGYARMLTEKTRLLLQPEVPVVFEVSFAGNEDEKGEEGFDAWFAGITSGFEDGGVYEAELPMYRTLDWWRYAVSSDLHDTSANSSSSSSITSTITAGVASAVDAVMQRWTGAADAETKYGVPVLPRDKQLPIYIEGEGVLFSCVGKNMEWPDELLEKQRVNKERRDGEEKRKAEEKRRAREVEKE